MRKQITFILCVALLLGALSYSPSSASIEDKEREAKDIQSEIDSKSKEAEAVREKEMEVKNTLYEVISRKEALEAAIEETDVKIKKSEEELKKLSVELEKASAKINKQKEEFGKRVSAMYMHQNDSFVEIILKSNSVSDFLNRLDYNRTINEQDRRSLDALQAEHEKVKKLEGEQKEVFDQLQVLKNEQKASKEELVAVEAELEVRAAELEAQRVEIQAEIDIKQNELSQVEGVIYAMQEEAAQRAREIELESQRNAAEEARRQAEKEEAERLAAAKAEEQRRLEEEAQRLRDEAEKARKEAEEAGSEDTSKADELDNEAKQKQDEANQAGSESETAKKEADSIDTSRGEVVDRGYMWPVPNSRAITSYFGWREEPIPGLGNFHKGLDIADSTGNPIVAVRGGVVTYSGWMSGYGNTVSITHDNGVTTLYAHCSAIYVSSGQYVSQGTTIGAIGSTGMSTGPHLHIGFFVGGSWVDPLGYIN